MSNLNSILEIGKRALLADREVLNTIGHNITNVNTEGYSRQRANLRPTLPMDNALYGQTGTGITVESITRARDQLLDSQVRSENASLGRWEQEDSALSEIQNLFAEPSDSGFSDMLAEFWDAWDDLANNPADYSARAVLRERSQVIIDKLNGFDGDLRVLEEKFNREFLDLVEECKSYANAIADLNIKIRTAESGGQNANDLRDLRDLALDNLSKIIEIKYIENDDGSVNVYLGGDIFIQGDIVRQITTLSSARNNVVIDELLFQDNLKNITMASGKLKGLLEARDVETENVRSRLDEFALGLVENINTIHRQGYGLNGNTGVDFFDSDSTSAGNIRLGSMILNDLDNIAAGKTNAPGDNSNALDIASLSEALTMNDNSQTFNDHYSSTVAQIGLKKEIYNSNLQETEAVQTQLANTRQSVQGVILDEELTEMIKFQQAFAAAARVVDLADDLMTTVINMGSS
jgi:flagellar hook-associated protein 1 FlgK